MKKIKYNSENEYNNIKISTTISKHLDHFFTTLGSQKRQKRPPAGVFVSDQRPEHTGYQTYRKEIGGGKMNKTNPAHGIGRGRTAD